jgi:hypothetical protein
MNFDGMWAESGSDPREALEPGSGEKAVLAEYLDRYRMTFELKCEGLSAEQLATRSVPPSTMSLLGLIRHLARVEHSWTRRVFEGHIELPRLYRTEEGPDLDFNEAVADDEVVAEAWDNDCASATQRLGPVPEGPVGRGASVTFDDLGRDFEPGQVTVTVKLSNSDGAVTATAQRDIELTRSYPNGKSCDGDGYVGGSVKLNTGDRV